MEKKITGDILTFKKAFDICSELMSQALIAQDHAGATALSKAMHLFHQAMEDSDAEMEQCRQEMEEKEQFASSEALAEYNRGLVRSAKHWGKDEEDREPVAPVFERGDDYEDECADKEFGDK